MKRQEDVFGLALAYASLKNRRDEATIEMLYQFFINEHISIMPDIQYVINSSGTDVALKNSLISFLRMRLDF